ncbi:hypothetical protein CHS0354_033710 [Potamilus streckersoni]|nr:hypothetical protein CHS0354_033710 [Potamilus streckersoni]
MTTACYGSDLECSTFIVHCNSNHIIVVGSMEYAIKETWPCVFGVSDCQRLEKTCCTFDIDDKKIPFYDADVVATHRLCSGRQQCQIEVPRIVEGASVSNYGVMHYKCMEDKKIVDMCSKGIHRGKDLYLMFDGNVYVKSSYFERGSIDCTCKVISSDCSSR